MLSSHSFNALLKTLEEPPPHVKFILATTDPHKVLPTILSRCQRYDLRRIGLAALTADLRADGRIAKAAKLADDALALIAREAEGSLRDAQSLLEQVLAAGDGCGRLAAVRALLGAADRGLVLAVADAMLARRRRDLPAAARDAPRTRVRPAALLPRPARARPASRGAGGHGATPACSPSLPEAERDGGHGAGRPSHRRRTAAHVRPSARDRRDARVADPDHRAAARPRDAGAADRDVASAASGRRDTRPARRAGGGIGDAVREAAR